MGVCRSRRVVESLYGGYSIPDVRRIDLASIGIYRTPTLLLVDEQGRLLQQWIGKLSQWEEDDVAAHVGLKSRRNSAHGRSPDEAVSVGAYSPVITTTELLRIIGSKDDVNFLDVRERTQYANGRIASALNAWRLRGAQSPPPAVTGKSANMR